MKLWSLLLLCTLAGIPLCAVAQSAANDGAELKYVVYFSRHGVRSPTGKAAQYNAYSAAAWPAWSVQPGYLTEHGYELMKKFGAFDRMQLASEGLFREGCADAAKVTFYADSDERTRETAKALSEGMFPGCNVKAGGREEGVNDPLFHPATVLMDKVDGKEAAAAVLGRIGGKAENLTDAYRAELEALDKVLGSCGSDSAPGKKRTSIFEIPASVSAGTGDHAVEMKGPLSTSATLTENILLEYTNGMESVGWGCVDGAKMRSLIDLHTASVDFAQKTRYVAVMQGSNPLEHIRMALEQAASGKAVTGAVGKVGDKGLFLVGHDTNLENMVGMLGLTWIADGRRDDTPPGSALVFELWKKGTEMRVRVFFTAQTLEQMRQGKTLDMKEQPVRVPIFLPGCSGADYSCSWEDFSRDVKRLIDPKFVVTSEK